MLSAILVIALLSTQSAPQRMFLWEYSTADLTSAEVNRFELKIDNGVWNDVGRSGAADQSEAKPGSVIYEAPVPALTLGLHTAQLRACNATECSDPLSMAFTISIKPAVPAFFRIGGAE
jgi:hypothetical protein